MGFFRVTVFLISLSYQGKSEKIRCYCNLDECLSNNLQCSYEDGGCFSDFLDYHNITQAKHGCLHLLERERRDQCGNAPGSSGSPKSLLLCCKTDMCNQVLGPVSIFTHSIIGSLINATEGQNNLNTGFDGNGSYDHQRYNTNELWFRAATIVVPVCGAMILLLLVVLAFKILRADHVTVEKYIGKGKSNAAHSDSQLISFKSSELNSKDLSKKIPLLYETRQNELRNSEDFRQCTSARIHFGQNVNILKDNSDPGKVEKNLENAKMNLEKPRVRQAEVATTSYSHSEGSNNASISVENNSNSTLDVRVEEDHQILPTLSLNLDKSESLNSCNIYTGQGQRSSGHSSLSVRALDKVYDKYLL